jgi:hypothetical protein
MVVTLFEGLKSLAIMGVFDGEGICRGDGVRMLGGFASFRSYCLAH